MSLTQLVAILAAGFLFSLLVCGAALWLASRWGKVPGMTYRRAVLSCIAIVAANLPLDGVMMFCALPVESPGFHLALALASLAVSFVCVKLALRARLARSLLVFLIFLGLSLPYQVGVIAVLHWKLMESFHIPTGAMAPTLLGIHVDRLCTNCGSELAVGVQSDSSTGELRRPAKPVVTRCPNCRAELTIPADASLRGGDRIIVDKTKPPARWDLVAFRYPKDPGTIYLKRLAGLPGETIEILDGDIFLNRERLKKPPSAALDLWVEVHDTARRPKAPTADFPGWRPGAFKSGWRDEGARWTFTGRNRQEERLGFSGPIDDALVYNALAPRASGLDPRSVGDVEVECTLEGVAGDGIFGLEWERGGRKVRGILAATGHVELTAGEASQAADLGAPPTPGSAVAFSIRDGQAYLAVNGQIIADLEVAPRDIESARRNLESKDTRCTVAIVAARCDLSLTRIVLRRDGYYRSDYAALRVSFNPVTLGPEDYFVLGDNSQSSADSRFWGPVPERNIVGTARWIFAPIHRVRALR